jgi:glutaconate CoA-transferase subunit B
VRARLLEAPPVASASADEVFIHALAAELAGARHVAVGSASPLPAAAAWLAHALSGGALRVAMLGGRDVFFTEGGRELFDCAARGRIDAFFLSGGQIDGEANINLMGVGRYPALDVRWGGTYGAPYLYLLAERVILFRDEHTRRVMVPRVDFVTAAGTSPPNVHRPGGPRALVTSRCVFRFDRPARRFRLQSVHPGQTVEEVRDHTGFDFDADAAVPTTPVPDAETLALLRAEVPARISQLYPQFTRRVFGP